MGIKVTTKMNKLPEIVRAYEDISGKQIQVGVYGEHAWLAGIHEYGCDITPKNAKYLTVPCNPKAYGKKAKDFPDLFLLELDDGDKFLVRNKGKDKLEFMFWLTKSVHIPERSFLRAGYDNNIDEVLKKAERNIKVLGNGMSVDDFLQAVGQTLADKIKDYAEDLKDPPNNPLTLAAQGNKENPLVDTGKMVDSITYRIE